MSPTLELSRASENVLEHSAFSPYTGYLSLLHKRSLSNLFSVPPAFLLKDFCSPAEGNSERAESRM